MGRVKTRPMVSWPTQPDPSNDLEYPIQPEESFAWPDKLIWFFKKNGPELDQLSKFVDLRKNQQTRNLTQAKSKTQNPSPDPRGKNWPDLAHPYTNDVESYALFLNTAQNTDACFNLMR